MDIAALVIFLIGNISWIIAAGMVITFGVACWKKNVPAAVGSFLTVLFSVIWGLT
jgi:hypothetical protein